MLEQLKVAAYLDEAGEDPQAACEAITDININYAVLRNAWTNSVVESSDRACAKLKKILTDNNVTPVAIISKLGDVPATQLMQTPEGKVNRVFDVATYYGAQLVRIQIGNKSPGQAREAINAWMERITKKSIDYNIAVVFEVTPDSHITSATELAELLKQYRRWRLLYDPAQFILKQNLDPFVKYWTLLKSSVGAIDVRDLKIGHGYKAVGMGNCRTMESSKDAVYSSYRGWFFMEPSLGRRHGSASTRQDVFKMACEAVHNLL
jgi:sugar phosphate isomerase/epimerase